MPKVLINPKVRMKDHSLIASKLCSPSALEKFSKEELVLMSRLLLSRLMESEKEFDRMSEAYEAQRNILSYSEKTIVELSTRLSVQNNLIKSQNFYEKIDLVSMSNLKKELFEVKKELLEIVME